MGSKENHTPDKAKCGTNETALTGRETREDSVKTGMPGDKCGSKLLDLPLSAQQDGGAPDRGKSANTSAITDPAGNPAAVQKKKTPEERFGEWLTAGGRFDGSGDRDAEAARHNVADSVFTNLFRIPKYALQLYQSLHPEDTETTEDSLKTVTLSNVLVNQMYNDLGLLALKKRLLVLSEAQDTWTLNALVRMPGYWALTIHRYIIESGQNLYGSKKVEIPVPEFYMIYTGKRKKRPEVLRLSKDFFGLEHTDVDITVKVLYGGRPGDILSQYVRFVQIYKEQYRRYGRTRRTVLETIRLCIAENVLTEYLESRREEVVTLMMTLFDQETAVEAYGRSLEKRCAKRINKLGQKLVSEGRMDDLRRSFTDEEFQQKLLKEYGL